MFEPISIGDFRQRTTIDDCRDLAHSWGTATSVVSLRDLVRIDAVQLMSRDYLAKLLGNVVLAGGNHPRVYEGCSFDFFPISPRAVRIGQTFVERIKYTRLLENFGSVLANYCVNGIADANAFIATGVTADGRTAIAHYLPPIVEMNGDGKWTLMDGVHRNFLTMRIGGTLPVIAIEGVKEKFPCDLHCWENVRPVDAKPPKEERFFNLKPELFRDVKFVGIDG